MYIAAFAPNTGEVNQLALDPIRFPGSRLLPPVLQVGPPGIARFRLPPNAIWRHG